jgi:hypothetical protein
MLRLPEPHCAVIRQAIAQEPFANRDNALIGDLYLVLDSTCLYSKKHYGVNQPRKPELKPGCNPHNDKIL